MVLLIFSMPFLTFGQQTGDAAQAIIDAPVVLNLDTKPDVKRELGNSKALGKNDNDAQKTDEVLLDSAQPEGEDVSVPKKQWIQSTSLVGSRVTGLLATDAEELYTIANGHIYKLQNDTTGWQHVSDISSITDVPLVKIPMAKWDNTLYIVPSHKLYVSKDDGKTWDLVHQWPEDYNSPNDLVLTEQAFYITFYKGFFRSEDKGKTWKNMNDELSEGPHYIVAIQDTVFAVTGAKIYRWDSDNWQRLELTIQEGTIVSITATKDRFYIAAINRNFIDEETSEGQRSWWIFRSTDLGNSWKNITPTHVWKALEGWKTNIRLVAAGETLMAMEQGMVRSTDGGDTWMPLQGGAPPMFSNSPAAALSGRSFYFGSWDYGLQRSTDGGDSWETVNVTPNKSGIGNIIVYKEDNKGKNTHPIIYGLTFLTIVQIM